MGGSGVRVNLLINPGQKAVGGIHMHPTPRAELFLFLAVSVPSLPFHCNHDLTQNFFKVIHVSKGGLKIKHYGKTTKTTVPCSSPSANPISFFKTYTVLSF